MESSSETVRGAAAVAMEFPMSDEAATSFSTPVRVPTRIKKRLLAECKTPSTVEEIEAKLRHADLRRQQFYEKLSSKARPKPRSPSQSSSHEEDLGQRLEAKLQAAHEKRSSILAKARMRLARLDELRQAAKTGVEMRFEREREMLGSKVESRVQQAELNRMLILNAYNQRRAKLKERSSQSLLRRMARESKYKERVRAAIHQKRVAAEKKRLGLLEAEKKKARARMLQVRRVAKFVSNQREIERRRMRDQLEDRLQRAKRQRAEYLRQRGRLHNTIRFNLNRMYKEADVLSRKLARCWRQFLKQKRTTLALAKAYDALKINENSIKSMPFEQLARLIESPTTLQTVKTLLDRLENRLKVFWTVAASNQSSVDNIDHLLKRVASPKKRPTPRTPVKSRGARNVGSSREAGRSPAKLSRYQVRVVLCAYMILGHPDAVFSGQGERELTLAKSAEEFVRQLELLIKIILEGPIQNSDEESEISLPKRWTFRSQLAAFDKAWCSYLNCFVVWKVKDAQSLEEDLVRAACQLELSMIQKCKMTPEGDNGDLTHDLKAIQEQVIIDQKLLREKVQHLSGDSGIERMESALSETRSKYFEAKENGSPVGSPGTSFLSPTTPSSAVPPASVASLDNRNNLIEGTKRPSCVVRSLFSEDATSSPKKVGPSATSSSSTAGQMGAPVEKQQVSENELIVNEFLHKQNHAFIDSLSIIDEDQNSIKAKIRETMEKAFWDGIMESMKQEEPNYDRVIHLVREVRDEICEMAPQSWKEEITEAIDLEILAQVLNSGNLDIGYLGRILVFALTTLQKLSSPANDDEMKTNIQKLLKELSEICQARDESNSHVIAMIKGLRFVLEQVQALKREISKARLRIMEPLLKGPAGLDYLKKAFANRNGHPSDAYTSLPLTLRWLSTVQNCKDLEWEEHTNSLSALVRQESSCCVPLPSTTLKTGGSFLVKTSGNQNTSLHTTAAAANSTDNLQPECKGETLDLLVRLGLLKLVSGISGITQETLPETFMLNLSRLRAVQAQIQKIIVIATSVLVCRQTLLSERVVTSPVDMENVISKYTERLVELLDHAEDAGLEEIVEIMSKFSSDDDKVVDKEKLQSRKLVMARMLAKCLQSGDPVFEKVSRAVYLATRGVVLGGNGRNGRKLAEIALRQVGAAMLTEKVVEAAEVLVVVATVSVNVHGPWYINLNNRI